MKANAFIASAHKCSGCGYTSLVKTQVAAHVKAKCPDAKILTEEQFVKHYDETDEAAFKATLYQCSKCAYTTFQVGLMNTHVAKRCVGAEVLSSKRFLCFHDIPKAAASGITNNIVSSTVCGNINNINVIYISAGSLEERESILKNITDAIDAGKIKPAADPSDWPVLIAGYVKGKEPRLDNKYVHNNNVVNRADNKVITSCVKHAKQAVLDFMNFLLEALKSPIDTDRDFMNFNPDEDDNDKEILECEDVVSLRREFIPMIYRDHVATRALLETTEFSSNIEDSMKEFEGIFGDAVYTDFFKGCNLIITNPYKFKTEIPTETQKQVRLAIKKYLSSLPRESRTRPNKTLT
jgi:hypothetical protein